MFKAGDRVTCTISESLHSPHYSGRVTLWREAQATGHVEYRGGHPLCDGAGQYMVRLDARTVVFNREHEMALA